VISAIFLHRIGMINEKVYNVGFRLKGAGSRKNYKKNFKLSFSTFSSGTRFYGLKQMAVKTGKSQKSRADLLL
jgi:hypothetical protein